MTSSPEALSSFDDVEVAVRLIEPTEGLRLVHPDEPVSIREGLRKAVFDGKDWREGFSDEVCVAVWLWDQWRPSLEPAGMDREAFVEVSIDYRRELWLWIIGERGWDQCVTGLAGRAARRLPSHA